MSLFVKYQHFAAKYFHTDTVFKAFITNAFITALIAIFTVETRQMLERYRKDDYSESLKGFISFAVGLFTGLVVYLLMWVIFNYGGGMVTINRGKHTVTPLTTIAHN
jgi:hypothetical protein